MRPAPPARSGLGPIWAHMGSYGFIYGPIWALMGPYGPQPGPGPQIEISFEFLLKYLRVFIKITCFFSFSNKNHAESSINFIKIPFLDPKRAKLDHNSDFGHVRTYS